MFNALNNSNLSYNGTQTHKHKDSHFSSEAVIFYLILISIGILASCSHDDILNRQAETSTEVQPLLPKKIPFKTAPHYNKINGLINKLATSLNDSALQNRGGGEIETFDILTDEVIFMEYDNSHTYTFKVRRSSPEYYIENVVLHYNAETAEYDEFLMQYPVNEQEFLEIVNGNFSSGEIPVIAQKFENGTFSGALRGLSCVTSCNTIAVNCTAGGNHAPGDACQGTPAQQPYTYVSCSTFCFIDKTMEDPEGGGGHGGGSYTNTVPFPMEPCNTGGGGSGSSGPDTGLDNGNGMCVVPWVAAMNAQLNLTQAELGILEDYPELMDLFGQYFAAMGNDADYGLIRSLINYMIKNDTPEGLEFVFWAIDYVTNNPNLPSGNIIEELENIYWLEHVYDGELQNNPCTAAVYNKMKNTKTMFKVIKQFMGAAPITHLEWKIENLSNVNATTRFKPGTNNELVQIRISNNYSNSASPISMARTMLHEALHADVLRKLVSVGGWPINPNVESEFPGLWEYWIKYKNGLNIGEAIGMALHNHMADWYRDKIKQGLIEFDMENGTTHEEWQYEALSWGGLYGTTAWNNLALQNPSLKNQYYNYIQQQQTAGGCP